MNYNKYRVLLDDERNITLDNLKERLDVTKKLELIILGKDFLEQDFRGYSCDKGVVFLTKDNDGVYAQILDYSKDINPISLIGTKDCLEESIKGIKLEEIQ